MSGETEVRLPPSTAASVVLELGGDVGALAVYVSAAMLGEEIELEPLEKGRSRTHSAVRERRIGEVVLYAAVYPGLSAGSYRVEGSNQLVRIEGGHITEARYEPRSAVLNLDPARLAVISVIALLVIGPERLPGVASQVARIWRTLTGYRDQAERELRAALPDVDLPRFPGNPALVLTKLVSGLVNEPTRSVQSEEIDSVGPRVTTTPIPPAMAPGPRGRP